MSKVSALTPNQLKRLKRRVNLNLVVNGNKMRGYHPIYSDGKTQEDDIYFSNSKIALQKLAKVEMLTAYSSADGQDSPSVGNIETVKDHTDSLGFKWRGVRLQKRAGKWYLFMSYHMNHGLRSTKPLQVQFKRDAPAKVDFGPMAASLSRSDFLVHLSSLLDTEHEIAAAIDSDSRKVLATELYGDADVRLAVCLASHGELIDDMKPALQARALRGVNELAANTNASALFDAVADAITAEGLEASVVSASVHEYSHRAFTNEEWPRIVQGAKAIVQKAGAAIEGAPKITSKSLRIEGPNSESFTLEKSGDYGYGGKGNLVKTNDAGYDRAIAQILKLAKKVAPDAFQKFSIGASVVSAAKRPTFVIAKQGLMDYLRKKGWNIKEGLKIPWAESPWNDGTRLWFRKQAIYIGKGRSPADAWSSHVDVRTVTPEQFMKGVEKRVNENFNLQHDYR